MKQTPEQVLQPAGQSMEGPQEGIWTSAMESKQGVALPPPPLQLTADPMGSEHSGQGPEGNGAMDGGEDEFVVPGIGLVTVEESALDFFQGSVDRGVEGDLPSIDPHLGYRRMIRVRTIDGRQVFFSVDGRTDGGGRGAAPSLNFRGHSQLSCKLLVFGPDGTAVANESHVSSSDRGSIAELIPECAGQLGLPPFMLEDGAINEGWVRHLMEVANDLVPTQSAPSRELPDSKHIDESNGSQGEGWGERDNDPDSGELSDISKLDQSPKKELLPWEEMTETQRRDEAWETFKEEFSWMRVVAGIIAIVGLVALLAILPEGGVLAQSLLAAMGLAMVVAGLAPLFSDLMSGVSPDDYEWLLGGLTVLLGTLILGSLFLGGPEAAAIFEIGGLLTVVAYVVVAALASRKHYEAGVNAPTREAMRATVQQSAHEAEEAIIMAGGAAAAKGGLKLGELFKAERDLANRELIADDGKQMNVLPSKENETNPLPEGGDVSPEQSDPIEEVASKTEILDELPSDSEQLTEPTKGNRRRYRLRKGQERNSRQPSRVSKNSSIDQTDPISSNVRNHQEFKRLSKGKRSELLAAMESDGAFAAAIESDPELIGAWNSVAHLVQYKLDVDYLKALNHVLKNAWMQTHVFEGHFYPASSPGANPVASGMHSELGMRSGKFRVKPGSSVMYSENNPEVYRAKVQRRNECDGGWTDKGGAGISTMFPGSWSKIKTLEEIAYAYRAIMQDKTGHFIDGNKYWGMSSDETIEINMFLNASDDRIISAFPTID